MLSTLRTTECKQWVGCVHALATTTEALHGYVKDTLKPMTDELRHSGNHGMYFFMGGYYGASHMKYNHFSNRWEMTDYGCSRCKCIVDKLLCEHRDPSSQLIGWKNLVEKVEEGKLDDFWAIAKVYMPQGNERSLGPNDTDAADFLTVIKTCKLFKTEPSDIQNIIHARNKLMHSADNAVSTDDMKEFLGYMCKVLEDEPSGLKSRPECQAAAQNIRMVLCVFTPLKERCLDITLQPEPEYIMLRKVLEAKDKALRHDIAVRQKDGWVVSELDPSNINSLKQLIEYCKEDLRVSTISYSIEDYFTKKQQTEERQRKMNEQRLKEKQAELERLRQQWFFVFYFLFYAPQRKSI